MIVAKAASGYCNRVLILIRDGGCIDVMRHHAHAPQPKNSFYTLSTVVAHDVPDPCDVALFEIALTAQVPLITGNLKHYPENAKMGCLVLSPKQFLDQMQIYGA